jgi:hypothetical protein
MASCCPTAQVANSNIVSHMYWSCRLVATQSWCHGVLGSGSASRRARGLVHPVGSSVSYKWGNGKGSALNWNKLGETKNHPR